jgi:hypothetical protein
MEPTERLSGSPLKTSPLARSAVMLAEIYMLRLEAAARAALGSGDQLASVRAGFAAGAEGKIRRVSLLHSSSFAHAFHASQLF